MKIILHKCSLALRHIAHTRTNRFFKLVEALLQTHSCFFSQSINVRGLLLSACHCLVALPAKMCAFNYCFNSLIATKRLLRYYKMNVSRFVAMLLLRNKGQH